MKLDKTKEQRLITGPDDPTNNAQTIVDRNEQPSFLTLPIRHRFIADCRKMHNLLTLVDRLDFICKRKRKSISVTKNKKIFSMV